MNNFLLAVALAIPLPVASAPDEQIVQEMALQTRLTPEEIRSGYDGCDSGVTLTLSICGGYNWRVQDIRMNNAYKQALVKAKAAGYQKSLLKAHKAWQVYRDAACAFEGQMGAGGGTAEVLYVLSCKEQVTRQHAERLEAAIRE